ANQVAQAPVSETLRRYWREVLLAAGARLTENACFYLFTVYVLTYGVEVLHIEKGDLLLAVNLGAAAEIVTMPLFGLLSDRTSRKGAYVAGCIILMVLAWPYYLLLNTREPMWIVVATVLVMAGGHAL